MNGEKNASPRSEKKRGRTTRGMLRMFPTESDEKMLRLAFVRFREGENND